MRLWSLHPRYLDSPALVACWREGLLAREVLAGRTLGYRYHPQLIRFREASSPSECINAYLVEIYIEAQRRGYRFDRSKLHYVHANPRMLVTEGQLRYEIEHLKGKLAVRNPHLLVRLDMVEQIEPHPIFDIVAGGIEDWEVTK